MVRNSTVPKEGLTFEKSKLKGILGISEFLYYCIPLFIIACNYFSLLKVLGTETRK